MAITRHITVLVSVVVLLLTSAAANGQKYKVATFRALPNDVSAFVNPVVDLNDEACALIKVEAPSEFAFSTPLGIVKREDHTGEIWLYIPKGSKKITFKHPEWGVLRDYIFPSKIESHLTYEIRLEVPEELLRVSASAQERVEIVHDTLVVTRTDTLMLPLSKRKTPLSLTAEATTGFGGIASSWSGGLMLALMKRHGGFIHVSTDFGRLGKTSGICDANGEIDGRLPYYSGKTRHSFLLADAGAIHQLSRKVRIFEGIGYGSDNSAWQLAESEGGGFVKNSRYSHNGFAFEAGAMLTFGKVAISASVMSIEGSNWYGCIGVGITFGLKGKGK